MRRFQTGYGQVGEEIGRVAVKPKTVKMKPRITQLSRLNPDFALAAFPGRENEVFFTNYYRFKANKTIPVVSLNTAATPNLLRSYEKTLAKYNTGVNLITPDVYAITKNTTANKHFVDKVKETYDTLPSYRLVWGYDTGRLLLKALAKLDGKWDGTKVVELMKTLPYTSPRQAQPLKFDSHGDVINAAYITKTRREGDRLVREVVDEVPPINMDNILK